MPGIVVEIPKELFFKVEELSEMKESIKEFVKLKIFELKLKRNREMQRFVLEALASRSKLTEKDALELGNKINEGILEELREKKHLKINPMLRYSIPEN
jgi:hypothetical protein